MMTTRKILYCLLIAVTLAVSQASCTGDESVSDDVEEVSSERDYRQEMRNFVQAISNYAKQDNPDFIIIPQNGHDLLTADGESDGTPAAGYIGAIDGVGREDLFYGYEEDNAPTPVSERESMLEFMDIAEDGGVEVLATDYCFEKSTMDDSYSQNKDRGYISFAADRRELDGIPEYPPEPYNVNGDDITTLSDAANFLYLLNPESSGDKTEFLDSLKNTDYDLLIIDAFYDEDILTESDVESLKLKKNGGRRLVFAYMSIGEAEDYRYYWDTGWENTPPPWLEEENPHWKGNYKVRYWEHGWQDVIYGNPTSYLRKILDAGFDGVYLDIIDAFEYFENR